MQVRREFDSHVCLAKHIWCGPQQETQADLLHVGLIWKGLKHAAIAMRLIQLKLGYLLPQARLGRKRAVIPILSALITSRN